MKSLVLLTLAVWAMMETAEARYGGGGRSPEDLNRHVCCSNLLYPATPSVCRRCIDPPAHANMANINFPYEVCKLCYQCDDPPDEVPNTDYFTCVDLLVVELDPHFIVEHHGSGNKLCFDYSGTSGQVISLVEDEASGTYVSGQLHQWDPNRRSTIFSKINIELGGVEMEFGSQDIVVDDEAASWTMTSPLTTGDVTVSPLRRDALSVHNAHTGVSFTVTRHKGDLIGYYLGVFVTEKGDLSSDTTGMLGQFFFAGMKVEDDVMTLIFPNAPSKKVPVSLQTKSTAGAVESQEQCWHYNPQDDEALSYDDKQIGDGLLGEYQQYIIDFE